MPLLLSNSLRAGTRLFRPVTSLPLTRSLSSSQSAIDTITAWREQILRRPVVVERDTVRSLTLQQLAMTLDKTTPSNSPIVVSLGQAAPTSPAQCLSSTGPTPPAFKKGMPMPINWHHAFFPPIIGEEDLGRDGYEMTHAPPEPFLARMWAGGGVEQNPRNLLRVGQEMLMKTKCTSVDIKQGRSGETMVFVSLEKQIENDVGWALTDTRTLVYMEKDGKTHDAPAPRTVKQRKKADFSMAVLPTAVLLFRYSALTFNSHRIHYDHEFANNVEGHPAPGQVIKNFKYRALSPLYVDRPITVSAKKMSAVPTMDADVAESYEVWVENSDGGLAMSGTVEVVHA
ncbi:hypothetical protein BGW38_001538 [Lunasporangiospora selenospora]|uniref:3-methylfumaryl-CoA hydratase n=1 Tax=Lunasporangiospora selenospora TaxID=979761 RepID=A0A9P6KDG3_9FUNG|nr:hypothetical protein BGW38_001538 [Lunasporangiospora selenospora]